MFVFGEHLRKIRKSRHLTQKQLAMNMGTSEQGIQQYELGKRRPTYDMLIALADYFDISMDYLVGRSDDPARHLSVPEEKADGEGKKMDVRKANRDSNEITRAYFDSLLVEMRLVGAELPDTKLHLYGETFSTPVMMAALSHLDKQYPDGMAEMARGAKAAGAVMWAGMGDEEELSRIVDTGAKTIKIVKPYAEEEKIYRRLRHAERCGALAVGMDIDHCFGRQGNYDNVLGEDMRPKTREQLESYIRATSLPFVVKGVLSVQDALACAEAGAGGIVVSHHHGIMDCAVPPLRVLPKIREALGKEFPIFVDCGFETGMDVYKALALGATAVSVGRRMMAMLVADGADGVKRAVKDMTGQLASVMARTGVKSLAEFDPSVIWER